MRLPPGPVRQFMAWQVLGQLALLASMPYLAYRHGLTMFLLIDSVMLIRAAGPAWNPAIAATTAALALGIGAGAASHFHRPLLSWYALRFALPLPATAYAISGASGWLMAFAWLRYVFAIAGWWAWFTSPELIEAKQWAQALFFVAWAMRGSAQKGNGPPESGPFRGATSIQSDKTEET